MKVKVAVRIFRDAQHMGRCLVRALKRETCLLRLFFRATCMLHYVYSSPSALQIVSGVLPFM